MRETHFVVGFLEQRGQALLSVGRLQHDVRSVEVAQQLQETYRGR
jgi:hypothetical protein